MLGLCLIQILMVYVFQQNSRFVVSPLNVFCKSTMSMSAKSNKNVILKVCQSQVFSFMEIKRTITKEHAKIEHLRIYDRTILKSPLRKYTITSALLPVKVIINLCNQRQEDKFNSTNLFSCIHLTFQILNVQNARAYSKHAASRPSNYYDVLGITPKANQTQIKSAYYRLSKLHHPDTKQGKENKMFIDITEAYEVLGNIQKRRLYDRGIINPQHHLQESEHFRDVDSESFNEQEGFKRRTNGPFTGRSKIYNFDEFYRQHYTETTTRRKVDKDHDESEKRNEEELNQRKVLTKISSALLIGSLLYACIINYNKN